MAYFAEIDENNRVLRVISVSNSNAPDPAPSNSELLGRSFIASLGIGGRWVQTSYNRTFRRRYAAIGMTYLEDHDAFVFPQPYPSWLFDPSDVEDWVPPVPKPVGDDFHYEWDEESQQWLVMQKPQKPNVEVLGED